MLVQHDAASSQIKPEIFPCVDLLSSFTCVTEAQDKMLIDCFQQGSSDENIYSPVKKKKRKRLQTQEQQTQAGSFEISICATSVDLMEVIENLSDLFIYY